MSKIEMAVWGAAAFVAASLFLLYGHPWMALGMEVASIGFACCEVFGGRQ